MGTLLLNRIEKAVQTFLKTLAECGKGASYAIHH
jgi:hypothetical protein